ncbi:GNAT family N-acetyltransferase [Laspinema olomoucense]|uniref:GNAT family N-acetyltransferase n=1 Tax=Laspinema olomoucense D3b TaxID=2953688 RepID=A0ABT2N3N8_9CYAN|nr:MULTISPECIES: GNAT family N-acetyltransferase [unclassified Laspinema]MCT7973337.1 GNAT family N-acetyltransferase [Laspinema sp. D3d]MCT7977277.1 GNAT family N-acetyltransferase [Laspinema sp. D3b]MCT7995517.1 GNAT family N-acetyltransferase [Laspinema sp. D3c]
MHIKPATRELIPGYYLRVGLSRDRYLLVKFLRLTYQELYPDHDFSHLAKTVNQYFAEETPLWWVEYPGNSEPVGCLWLGNAVDQVKGDRHAHIFVLYVAPEHRRRGVGSALMEYAENWARERGDRQMGLQVFLNNPPALNLYQKLGYQSHSVWMLKSLE